jgi:hypothetical protein
MKGSPNISEPILRQGATIQELIRSSRIHSVRSKTRPLFKTMHIQIQRQIYTKICFWSNLKIGATLAQPKNEDGNLFVIDVYRNIFVIEKLESHVG